MTTAFRVQPLSQLSSGASPLDDIRRQLEAGIEPVPVRPGYKLALFFIAIAMVLLPLAYIALIGLAGYGVYWHAINDTWMLSGGGGRAWVWKLVAYLTPMLVGGIVLAFMVKPLVARAARPSRPLSLTPQMEPVFYEFVTLIADAVGSPRPRHIHIVSDVDASASFRRGMWSFFSHDLVLTVGMPLIRGMPAAQLAGVIAHEFGHFTQGAGMRLGYLIRRTNHWFARVVFQRDQWDQRLRDWSKQGEIYTIIPALLARMVVFIVRKLLYCLMWIGYAISSFASRQQEYDADRVAARLVGSQTNERALKRVHLLAVAEQGAKQDLWHAWQEHRLCDDLPALIVANLKQLKPEVVKDILMDAAKEKTGIFDTHPAYADRVGSLRREECPRMLECARLAEGLLRNAQAVSKASTFEYYQGVLGGEISQTQLVPVEKLVSQQQTMQEDNKIMQRHFQGMVTTLRPLPELFAYATDDADPSAVLEVVNTARRELPAAREPVRKLLKILEDHTARWVQAHQLAALSWSGIKYNGKSFGLPKGRSVPDWLNQVQSQRAAVASQLDEALSPLRTRLAGDLSLLGFRQVQAKLPDAGALYDEAGRMVAAANAIRGAVDYVESVRVSYAKMVILAQSVDGNRESQTLYHAIKDGEVRIKDAIRQLRPILEVEYPFSHADGQVTLWQFACPDDVGSADLGGAMNMCDSVTDRLDLLYIRVMGRLAAIGEMAEKACGLEPLPAPAEFEQPELGVN